MMLYLHFPFSCKPPIATKPKLAPKPTKLDPKSACLPMKSKTLPRNKEASTEKMKLVVEELPVSFTQVCGTRSVCLLFLL